MSNKFSIGGCIINSKVSIVGVAFVIVAFYFAYSIIEVVKLFNHYRKGLKSITLEEFTKTFFTFAVIIFSADLIQMVLALITDVAAKPFYPLIAPGLGTLVNTKINLDSVAFYFIALNISWIISRRRHLKVKESNYFFTVLSMIALVILFVYITVVPIFSA